MAAAVGDSGIDEVRSMKITIIGGGPGGLYFAILAARRWPDWEITVHERNRAGDTFGFGVVFSDETLGFLREHDAPSYEAIRRSFAYWDDVDVHFKGRVLRCAGNGFCGCSRGTLLQLLQARCRELGVKLLFSSEIDDLSACAGSDLIVAADGANSWIRDRFATEFGTRIEWHGNYFTWLGSTREMDAFKYFFRRTPQGIFNAHCYQYEPGMSTWVVETTGACWEASGFAAMSEAECVRALEGIFAEDLDGHRLIANRSLWRRFPAIHNERWWHDNIVLLGDAQHTAHWSIGSGTKLAMESAIALCAALADQGADVPAALAHFDAGRREAVERTQHAARISLAWFENVAEHWELEPEQFAFQLMSRSRQITYDNLQLRDAAFVARCRAWFAARQRAAGHAVSEDAPPMFAPFALRGLHLANRVVVSPMAQYSALDGMPGDWHFVHYASRALGGAALVLTEMTCPAPQARITPGCAGLWNEHQRDAWRRIVDFVHAHTRARIGLQLGHAGRKGSTRIAWEGMDRPLAQDNWPIWSASPIPYQAGNPVPMELDRAQMDVVREQFVAAARLGAEAGFDLLEVHMAHGYLLASFISPLTNRRSDGYGGDIGARMRYPLEVFTAVRAAWPAERPVSVRISACDWAAGGLSEADLLALCTMLREAGVDLINVSTGQTVPDQRPVYGRMFQVPFADRIRQCVGVPVLSAGNITSADQVNTIVLSGRADLVALARPHLSDPYFTLRAAAWYGYEEQPWSEPYLSARDQALALGTREREQLMDMRRALKPPSHAPGERGGA